MMLQASTNHVVSHSGQDSIGIHYNTATKIEFINTLYKIFHFKIHVELQNNDKGCHFPCTFVIMVFQLHVHNMVIGEHF